MHVVNFIKKCSLILIAIFILPGLLVYGSVSDSGEYRQAFILLDDIDFGDDITIHSLEIWDREFVVCLDLDPVQLEAQNGVEVERLSGLVREALIPLDWRSLSVQAYSKELGRCIPLSNFLPKLATVDYEPEYSVSVANQVTLSVNQISGSLSGKTVYISAGHGWHWTDYGWRTQRVVYEGFIEDHNNAEAVDQYLIPYLENAGANVIPVRERDWNLTRTIGDNDDGSVYSDSGTWTTSGSPGYAGSTYRYAISENGSATATATWNLNVTTSSEYAVYAWVKPGGNRVPDAHYVIHHAGGQTEVLLDQRFGPETWRYLGTFPFYAGPVMVTLDNRSNIVAGTAVIADAIRVGGGTFDSLTGIYETASDAPYPSSAPNEPYWETAAYYYSQWMGMNPNIWSYFNDVIARPLYARWNHAGTGEDAVYVSWHSNGWRGITRGTESYVHNNDTCNRTTGSLELQSALHNELIHDIRTGWDTNWIDRGKKQANLGEIRMLCEDDPDESEIPGVLLEIAFHDEQEDANALKNPQFNQLSARALYQGIVKYYENRDSINLSLLPEPPTHLQVRNTGTGQLSVSWNSSPTDSSGLLGDTATAYRVYTSADGFGWGAPIEVSGLSYLISDLSEGEVVYVKVTGVNAGGESFPTEIMGARVGNPQILVVNGFDMLSRYGLIQEYDAKMQASNLRMWIDQINARDYIVHHGDAIDDFSGWDSAANEAVVDALISLSNYEVVDWILGEESTLGDGSFSTTERNVINTYLSGGGGLFISGSEFGWDLEYLGLDPSFLHDSLHTDYLTDDAQTYTVAPVTGGVFTGLTDFSFDAAGEYNVDFADVFSPLSGASSSLSYVGGTGGSAAIQYEDPARRILVMGFPFEVIQPDMRIPVMSAALEFLGTRVTDTVIEQPDAGGYYNTTPAFQGTAVGEALTRVEVQVQDLSNNFYLNGVGWGGETWVIATGTSPWSYSLPGLSEGTYRLSARAVGEIVDDTPAERTIVIDMTAPDVPTALYPTDSMTTTLPVVDFQWLAPVGDASPLSYTLEIDGHIYFVDGLRYLVSLPNGWHTWRVAAIDAAGNQGPWTMPRLINIDSYAVFMSFITR